LPRQRYPSDDRRRKQRPHVKIHLSIRGHPRYGHVFRDPELRGFYVGVLVLAGERFAARRHDRVWLSSSDATWITGRERSRSAWIVLERLFVEMGWRVCWEAAADLQRPSSDPAADLQRPSSGTARTLQSIRSVLVEVRNFTDKQGYASATPHVATDTPHPSKEPRNQGTEEPIPSAESAPQKTPDKPAPAQWTLDLSDLLIEKVKPVPGARIPPGARARWAREIELLVRETTSLSTLDLDKPRIAEIRRGIEWAFSPANLGVEFEVVIRSGRSLREKWTKLCEAKKRTGRRSNGSGKKLCEMTPGTREYCIQSGTPYNEDDDPTQGVTT